MNSQMLKFLKETFLDDGFEDNLMFQDFILPLDHVKEGLILNDDVTGIYPVWLVPSRLYFPRLPDCILPSGGDVMYVDVGVYGHSHLPTWKGRDSALRKFEHFTIKHHGYQALYAETLMTYEEFTTMFPREMYDKVSYLFDLSLDIYK